MKIVYKYIDHRDIVDRSGVMRLTAGGGIKRRFFKNQPRLISDFCLLQND